MSFPFVGKTFFIFIYFIKEERNEQNKQPALALLPLATFLIIF